MLINVGDNKFEVACNAFTPIVYSRYFTVGNTTITRRPKDINEAIGSILVSLNEYGFPPIVPMLEIFYACIKTADPKFDKKFDEWVSEFPPESFDLGRADGWATDVMHIVEDNFFPSQKEDLEAAPAGEKHAAASK